MTQAFRSLLGPRASAAALTLTISHTMFPSTQTDIEVWFSLTDARLKTIANGGSVVNANHRRIATDFPGLSLLKYDIVTPTATTDSTGLIEGWFLLPTGSSSVDTVVYLAYNDNGITTYQGDRAGTWARKAFANHGSEDGATVATNNYGTTVLTMAPQNTPTVTSPGKLGIGSVHYVAASSQHLARATGAVPTATNTFTLSAWIKLTSNGFYQAIMGNGRKTVGATLNNFNMDVSDTNKLRCYFTQGDGTYKLIAGNTSLLTGTDYRAVGTYDGANLNVYLNGVVDHAAAPFTGNADSDGTMDFCIGRPGFNNSTYFDGDIDEPWADVAHADSADRILAQYRNQSAPATFITVT